MIFERNFENITELINGFANLDIDNCYLFYDENGIPNYLIKDNSRFVITGNIAKGDIQEDNLMALKNINNKTYHREKGASAAIKVTNSMFKSRNHIDCIKFTVSSFESENFRDGKFFQLVIGSDRKLTHIYNIFDNLVSIKTERTQYSLNGISFQIKDIEFILYFIDGFCVIENLQDLDFEKFDIYCRHIMVCFGFISGYAPAGEGFYFGYDNKNFIKFNAFAFTNTFSSTYNAPTYQIIDTNVYRFMPRDMVTEDIESKRTELGIGLKPISCDVFSRLCNMAIDERQIADALYLILEANSSSLEVQGVLYSVILEKLTGYIVDKNEDKVKPIADKEKAKELLRRLNEVASEFLGEEYRGSAIAIKKNIENINRPTNNDKLIKPFEILDIPINDDDKNIIGSRNKFLHGAQFIEGDDIYEFANNHLLVNMKLNFLVCALILKMAKYDGRIINMVKVFFA